MKASFYAFSIEKHDNVGLHNLLRSFVNDNKPEENKDITHGFLNFETQNNNNYIYFEYFEASIKEKNDPRGIGVYPIPIRVCRQIIINKTNINSFILLIFTPSAKERDKILSLLPIALHNRSIFSISADFIEFINKPKDEWYDQIFNDLIEPRGRKGQSNRHSTIIERYAGPDDRERALEGTHWVFRDFAEVLIAVTDIGINLRVYPDGKFTLNNTPYDKKSLAPYITDALQILKNAESKYNDLRSQAKSD